MSMDTGSSNKKMRSMGFSAEEFGLEARAHRRVVNTLDAPSKATELLAGVYELLSCDDPSVAFDAATALLDDLHEVRNLLLEVATDPAQEPAQAPATDPAQEPAQAPATDPAQEPAQEPQRAHKPSVDLVRLGSRPNCGLQRHAQEQEEDKAEVGDACPHGRAARDEKPWACPDCANASLHYGTVDAPADVSELVAGYLRHGGD